MTLRKFSKHRRKCGLRLVVACCLYSLGALAIMTLTSWPTSTPSANDPGFNSRRLLSSHVTVPHIDPSPDSTSPPSASQVSPVQPSNLTSGNSQYPGDLFSPYQLSHGAIGLHVVGVVYMFVALAIVCDEFFVPALEVIIERLQISEDVAGATFMAAGGSAPELFTSVFGVFVSKNDVGIGTIVGSAVFNILFVIGMCAVVSSTVLQLTWWPLFRDMFFYSASLILLITFFSDTVIHSYEAAILLAFYVCYVTFMKYNRHIESAVKSVLPASMVAGVGNEAGASAAASTATNATTSATPTTSTNVTSPAQCDVERNRAETHRQSIRNRLNFTTLKANSQFHSGLLQLMIHTIDPLGDGHLHERATEMHAMATVKPELNEANKGKPTSMANGVSVQATKIENGESSIRKAEVRPSTDTAEVQSEVNQDHMLDISWPSGWRKRTVYVLIVPIIIPLYITLPDVRQANRRKWYPWTFVGSIIWIGLYSFLMNWWADTTGKTVGIPDSVMGLTFLAAGTSIPDLLTSVIVAKKGFGDMAVSSSVGSNLFDITVGLPMPWLMYTILENDVYLVDNKGMFCSIVLLFLMLVFVIITIAAFRWRMHRSLGLVMFGLYFVFLALTLLLQFDILTCPVG